MGLLAAAGKRYRAYSLGMRQRLAIAAALLAPRDLLILDEPTNGLDPQGTREVRHLVASLAADGTTVLVSSHLLSEVEQMCSHVGVMREGRLVAQGTVGEVRAAGAAAVVEVTTAQPELAAADAARPRASRGRDHRDRSVRAPPATSRRRRSWPRSCRGRGRARLRGAGARASRTCSCP